MKKNFLLAGCIILLQYSASSKIWRVNNTGVPADFFSAQGAVSGASAGDTLHFEASGTSYGPMTLDKRLIIIGNGFFLGTLSTNANPDLQANPATSHVGGVVFGGGSNGSVMMGMTCDGITFVSTSNITARRNQISPGNVSFNSCSSVQFIQNYVSANSAITGTSATNLQINNNLIGYYISMDANSSGDFMNNVIAWGNTFSINFTSFRIWNNILVSGGATFNSCDVRNNIGNGTQFGTANGNQQNVTMTTVFNDLPNTDAAYSEDSRFTLKAGSPAIGAANGGGDAGVFGISAGNAYVLSGIPNVPAIYKLIAPSTVTTNTINITISTRTNQ